MSLIPARYLLNPKSDCLYTPSPPPHSSLLPPILHSPHWFHCKLRSSLVQSSLALVQTHPLLGGLLQHLCPNPAPSQGLRTTPHPTPTALSSGPTPSFISSYPLPGSCTPTPSSSRLWHGPHPRHMFQVEALFQVPRSKPRLHAPPSPARGLRPRSRLRPQPPAPGQRVSACVCG